MHLDLYITMYCLHFQVVPLNVHDHFLLSVQYSVVLGLCTCMNETQFTSDIHCLYPWQDYSITVTSPYFCLSLHNVSGLSVIHCITDIIILLILSSWGTPLGLLHTAPLASHRKLNQVPRADRVYIPSTGKNIHHTCC